MLASFLKSLLRLPVVPLPTTGLSTATLTSNTENPSAPSTRSDPFAVVFSSLVWLVCAASAFSFVSKYGSIIPFQDELCNLKFLQGHANTWEEYWSPHNEHRMPLPHWIYKTAYTLTAGNVKSCQYLNATFHSLAAALVLFAAIRLRGYGSYSDALIPLLLVGPSHWEALTMGFLVQFTTGLFLSILLLTLMITIRGPIVRWPVLLLAFATTLLLGTCGSNSLTYMPAGGLWLAWIAVTHWRQTRFKSITAGVMSLASLAGFVVIFKSLPMADHVPATFANIVKITLQFLSLSLGISSKGFGEIAPGYPWAGIVIGVALLAVALWSFWQLRNPNRSPTAAALICFGAGLVVLTAGIAYGRAGFTPSIMNVNRYATLASPILLLIYLAMIVALPKNVGRFWSAVGLFIVVLVTWPNWIDGKTNARIRSEQLADAELELKAGMPIPFFCDRYWNLLYYPGSDFLLGYVNEYAKEPLSVFYHAKPMPEVDYTPLPYRLISRDDTICWTNEVKLADTDGSFELKLFDKPREIYAVELRYTITHQSPGDVINKITTWPHHKDPRFHPIQNQLSHSNRLEMTKIYLDRPLDRIRIDLHFASGTKFTIHSLREITKRAETGKQP